MMGIPSTAGILPARVDGGRLEAGGTRRLILLLLLLLSCSSRREQRTTIEFWGLGYEGEVVAQLIPQFERENPGVHVDVQQIPWTAAHEKILTAHVGGSLPDVGQVGNTWVPELMTVGAIEALDARVGTTVPRADYFPGVWDTNVVNGRPYGIPWYVDTRMLFYRTDLIPVPPKTWSEWIAVMDRLKRSSTRRDFHPLLMPTNEWAQPVTLALQKRAPLISEDGHALFDEPRFLEAFAFYLSIYKRGYAPVMSASQIANLFQQFRDGDFAMFVSGPWDVGNMRKRLPDFHDWSTTPLPVPDGTPYPGPSLAGGSSLVLYRQSKRQDAAWKLIEFLSRPDVQKRFSELTGDLPARRSVWSAIDERELNAFRAQLDRTVALPSVPEMENIVTLVFEHGQLATRGVYDAQTAVRLLDGRAEQMLEKRRWVLARVPPASSRLPVAGGRLEAGGTP
jgi:multiple sugar transport system substrate-binding protein